MAKPAGYYTDSKDRKRPITEKQTAITDFLARQENLARKKLLGKKDSMAERRRLAGRDYSEFEKKIQERFLKIVGAMYVHQSFEIQPAQVRLENKTIARVLKEGRKLTLQIHPYFLDLTEEQQDAVLRHEAIHIAHHRHDSTFRYYARLHKAPFYLADIFKIPYSIVDLQKDKSEVKIKDFGTYDEAYRFAKNYARDNRGKYNKLLLTQIMTPELKERMKLFNF